MAQPIVVIAEQLSPATREALGPDFDVRDVDGTNRVELLAALADAHAVLIRSATQIDREAISHAPGLKVIARAGVGLDNVDIAAATEAGVMVVNAPTSNIISAAELAIGHLLSLSRNIPDAHHSMREGQWKRSSFSGVELYEKTIGIIGLGRIGALVAERLQGFGATLIGFDPYVQPARAAQMGVELTTLDDLMARSDFITVHIPRTPETTGLIGEQQLAMAKPSLRIVNASRGGIIDEDALVQALQSGTIAGAGLDVFVNEPPTGSALLTAPNVILTPHLGASTEEAQEKAGVSVARSVRLALAGELVPDAVNVAGGVIDQSVKPGLALMENLGQVFIGLCESSLVSVDVTIRGEIVQHDVSVLKLAALKGIFQRIVSEKVSYVNAPVLAESRGVAVSMHTDPISPEYRNHLEIRGVLGDGSTVSVGGTLMGPKQTHKLTEINGYEIEVPLASHHIVMIYADRPGIVAVYGKEFGEHNINIAGMQIAREAAGGEALSVLTVDSRVDEDILDRVAQAIDARVMRAIDVVEL